MVHPYCTKGFAESLPHIGIAEEISAWGTHVLDRPILHTNDRDCCGVYPLIQFGRNIDFTAGLQHLNDRGYISGTFVLTEDQLKEIPKDLLHHVKPFKPHYVARSGINAYTRYHRRYVSKANRQVETGILDLKTHLDDWIKLYDYTANRHHFSSMHRFPRIHHETLATLEGITSIGAWVNDELVSAHIWAHDDRSAHSHLVASTEKGYETNAAYAVNDFSLKHFRSLDMINFGGSAGFDGKMDGLARFKSGFCNDIIQSYVIGIILNQPQYAQLSQQPSTFFPAYRDPFLTQEVHHEHSR
ncbi:MAG: hypothetical protein KF798_00935 [Candidatus Paracaedibacteraceae bacterium]|nr:hypothetical protein [Candidatus Paracaedibacteraceae bacterium]